MNTDYEDQTVENLRDELRDRDLRVSGSKDDLVARLVEDDARADDGADEGSEADTSAAGNGARDRGGASMREVLDRIKEELHDVTGLTVERASGLQRDDDGNWQAQVEVVEVSRVPPSTDVLAIYEVQADARGSLTSFDRVQRYRRSEAMNP